MAVAGYPGRTYRFMSEPVLFEFGIGEHYTTFSTELRASDVTVSLSEARRQLPPLGGAGRGRAGWFITYFSGEKTS